MNEIKIGLIRTIAAIDAIMPARTLVTTH